MNTYNQNGLTMREAINRGVYYHVAIPSWASGGMDVIANSAKEAALHVGCMLEKFGGANRPDTTKVHKHLAGSSIGCAMLDEAESCQTLTASHYCI